MTALINFVPLIYFVMTKYLSRLLLVFFAFAALVVNAQIQEPIKWTFEVKKVNDTQAQLLFKAKLDKGWHLYSQFTPENGPLPTVFNFDKTANYSTEGKVIEPAYTKKFEEVFEVDVYYFEPQTVTFTQNIKLLSTSAFAVTGIIDGMVCNDGGCIPFNKKFIFNVNADAKGQAAGSDTSAAVVPATNAIDTTVKAASLPALATDVYTSKMQKVVAGDDYKWLEAECGTVDYQKVDLDSLWSVFFLAFGAGLLALLMPCLFPLIPLNVSFFTKHSPTRAKGIFNAIVYGLSIIFIFVVPGYIVTKVFGSDALNALSTSAFFNWLFFIVFIVFAISFFGAFELTLPSRFVNKIDKQSDRGGIIGIFFMAFTLVLVSFSCTGPLLGTLMVEAVYKGGDTALVVGLFGFAVALALPFMLFAMFPAWLNTLPKSGGWLGTVKVTFGFIELALAMKFISNIDLAYHWGFLKRELFIAIWVAIFAALALYLLGKIRMDKEGENKGIGTLRMMFALTTLSFTVYLSTGLFGGPVSLLAGYLPPAYYTESNTEESHCPAGFNCFNDLDEGMNFAKQQGKPVMIDFTGFNCANCRQMEDNVFVNPTVKKLISTEYVLISLYCDDKASLPAGENYVSDFSGDEISTVGGKWSDLQKKTYNANAQPMYVLVDNDGKMLNVPRSHNLDIAGFEKFLRDGLCRYDLRKNKK